MHLRADCQFGMTTTAQEGMMQFVATTNIPGYLPEDDEPPVFDTAAEAWEYLASERERAEDECATEYGAPYTETVDELHIRARAGDCAEAGVVYGRTPGSFGIYDLGRAYCVQLLENAHEIPEGTK